MIYGVVQIIILCLFKILFFVAHSVTEFQLQRILTAVLVDEANDLQKGNTR